MAIDASYLDNIQPTDRVKGSMGKKKKRRKKRLDIFAPDSELIGKIDSGIEAKSEGLRVGAPAVPIIEEVFKREEAPKVKEPAYMQKLSAGNLLGKDKSQEDSNSSSKSIAKTTMFTDGLENNEVIQKESSIKEYLSPLHDEIDTPKGVEVKRKNDQVLRSKNTESLRPVEINFPQDRGGRPPKKFNSEPVKHQYAPNTEHGMVERKLKKIRGNAKKTMVFFCSYCVENQCNIIKGLTYGFIGEASAVNKGSIKTVVNRLKQDGLLEIQAFGRGPGTTIDVLMSDFIISFYSKFSLLGEKEKVMATSNTISEISPAIIKNNNDLPDFNYEAWEEEIDKIDLEHIVLKTIYFGKRQFDDIKKSNRPRVGEDGETKYVLTPKEINDSLQSFIYDLEEGADGLGEISSKRLPLIMSLLRVKRTPYISKCGWEDPEDRIIREMITLKKKKLEEKKRLDDELLDVEFETWVSERGREELINLVPPVGDFMGNIHKQQVKDYFCTNILSEILGH